MSTGTANTTKPINENLELAFTTGDAWLRDKRGRIFSITEKSVALLAITAGWAASAKFASLGPVAPVVIVTIVAITFFSLWYIWSATFDYRRRATDLKKLLTSLSSNDEVRKILSPFEGDSDKRSIRRGLGHSAAVVSLAVLCIILIAMRWYE